MTAENTADAGAPDTIVLTGLWVTPAAGRSGSSATRTRVTACSPLLPRL